MITNRPYQDKAISAAMAATNGVCVLPTGSGKSVICAGIVAASGGKTLVLQPSLEILQSNVAKARLLGMDPAIYSASAGEKNAGKITYATIGSIIKKLDLFAGLENLIIDECHLVNAKGGMYEKLIAELKPGRLIGLTATPYRLSTSSYGSSMKILTRTRPKIFSDILHVSNPSELIADGYLLEPEFISHQCDESMLKINSTGAEFTGASQEQFARRNNMGKRMADAVTSTGKRHILGFCDSVAESVALAANLNAMGIPAAEINANTDKKTRAKNLQRFESGEIRVMCNVGTLTTGYDFPALDCIIDGAATMSAALHYQKIGRVVRPYPGKSPIVYDLAGNVKRLGNPLRYTMLKTATGNGYEVYSEIGRVTTRIMAPCPEHETKITFGKYSGKLLADVDDGYVEWGSRELKGENRHLFYAELMRRRLFSCAA